MERQVERPREARGSGTPQDCENAVRAYRVCRGDPHAGETPAKGKYQGLSQEHQLRKIPQGVC